MVQPEGSFGSSDLVAQVHSAPEGPAHLELSDCAAFELDQRDAVVIGLDRVDERIGPAHDLERPIVLSDEVSDDLDAVTAEGDDRTTTGLASIPEPRAVLSAVRLARARPRDVAHLPLLSQAY